MQPDAPITVLIPRCDRAGERLIIDAAVGFGPRRIRPSATALSRSAGTATLVNHALASGDPRASALLYGPGSAEREPQKRSHRPVDELPANLRD